MNKIVNILWDMEVFKVQEINSFLFLLCRIHGSTTIDLMTLRNQGEALVKNFY